MGDSSYIMKSINAYCSLRTERRSWGLSQRELALLLGMESRAHISRLERGKRSPTLETALACSTLFGVPLGRLFPEPAINSEELLRERILELKRVKPQHTTPAEMRKRELLERALCKNPGEANDPEV